MSLSNNYKMIIEALDKKASIGLNKLKEDLSKLLPSHSASDAGKVLKVNASNGLEWATASSGGAEKFVVNFNSVSGDSDHCTCDKTLAEINTAYEAGKTIVGTYEDDILLRITHYLYDDDEYEGQISIAFCDGTEGGCGRDVSISIVYEDDISNDWTRYLYGKVPYEFNKSGYFLTNDDTGHPEWAQINQVPNGGTTNQVLTKTSSGYDWADASSSGTGLPTTPTSNGTYFLKCVIVDGTPTLSWDTLPLYNGDVS